MAYSFPEYWHSAHRDIFFQVQAPWFNSSSPVSNTGGFLTFTVVNNPTTLAGTKYIYVDSGPYQGKHYVSSIVPNGGGSNLITATPYSVSAADVQIRYLWPFNIRIWAGYPSPEPTDIVIRTFYYDSPSAIVNIAPFIKSLFYVVPPMQGVDQNLFTHIKVEVLPGQTWANFMTETGATIPSMTGYDMEDHTCWLANGCLPHDQLMDLSDNGRILTNAPEHVIQQGKGVFSLALSNGTIITSITT